MASNDHSDGGNIFIAENGIITLRTKVDSKDNWKRNGRGNFIQRRGVKQIRYLDLPHKVAL